MMAWHEYRITVDVLHPGGEGTESISFFASTPHDILVAARDLREHLGCTACMAIRFALARCLLAEESAAPRRSPSLVSHTGTQPVR
jgi:hypothetical protein